MGDIKDTNDLKYVQLEAAEDFGLFLDEFVGLKKDDEDPRQMIACLRLRATGRRELKKLTV